MADRARKESDCESRYLKWHNSRNSANGFLCRYGFECGTRPINVQMDNAAEEVHFFLGISYFMVGFLITTSDYRSLRCKYNYEVWYHAPAQQNYGGFSLLYV